MRRREFIAGLGAAVWPLDVNAQQPAMPVIGFLDVASLEARRDLVAAFHRGLKETGYVEGQNVAIEYRWAGDRNDRLPELAADLVRRQVTVIAALGTQMTLAAKAATATIPIVFFMGADPVELGFVASLHRPGGNVTGVTSLNVELVQKRLELVHELIPTATMIALLVNPASPNLAQSATTDAQAAARTLGLKLEVLQARTERDFDTLFATLVQLRAGGLVIGPDAYFNSQIERLAALTVRHAVPTIYQYREFAAAGGLMSYGGSIAEAYRQAGVYSGRILKGEKPADLPVQQAPKGDLFINLKTAKALGLAVPESLLARADEVIE